MKMKFRFLAIVAALSIVAVSGVTQAAPELQINWLTGQATILGQIGDLSAFQLSARTAPTQLINGHPAPAPGTATDVIINPGNTNALGAPGSDGLGDGESYFARRPTSLSRYVGFAGLQDSTVTETGPGDPNSLNLGAAPSGLSSVFSPGIFDPGGFASGSILDDFVADLPHILGFMFKPNNPALTQASATQNLRFIYGVPGDRNNAFAGQIQVINYVPEPAGLALLGTGLLGLVAARRTRKS